MHALILTPVISACRAIGICTGTGRHGSRQEIPGERRSPFQRSFLGNVFRQSVAQGICSLHGVACSQLRPSKSPPFRERTALPLSSRPELRRSAVEGSAVVSSAANPKAVTTPALVIPTGAPQERSGGTCPERSRMGTCGSASLPWKCFSTERSLRNIDQRKVNMFDCLAVPGVGHLQVAARGLDNRRDVVAHPCVLVLSRELQVAVLNLAVG
jgi:hypothetical protein